MRSWRRGVPTKKTPFRHIDKVIDRPFYSSYDLAQFADAKQWCDEGQRRFPADYHFAICHLRLLASRAEEPDIARAWRLRDSVKTIAPGNQREFWTSTAQLLVAAVLARAKLADSARHVIQRSRANSEIDPTHDLAEEEAYAYTLLGDNQAAFTALKTYWTANPNQQKAMADNPGWKFELACVRPGLEEGGRGSLDLFGCSRATLLRSPCNCTAVEILYGLQPGVLSITACKSRPCSFVTGQFLHGKYIASRSQTQLRAEQSPLPEFQQRSSEGPSNASHRSRIHSTDSSPHGA